MDIRRLTDDDIPAAVRLSTQAGWNQLPVDWRRLLELSPEQCYAGWVDGQLVATASVVAYEGRIGWIGMILVDEQHRNQGYGSRMFRRALDGALDRDLRVGLDATDAGRRVYSKVGFADVAPIERWGGVLDAWRSAVDATVRTVGVDEVRNRDGDIRELDRVACGVDRGRLLERLLDEPEAAGFIVGIDTDERPRGYALVRPGRERWQIGPMVADDARVVGTLLDAVGEHLGDAAVVVDFLEGTDVAEALEKRGLVRQRRLTRMVRGEPRPLLMGDRVVAAAGFELG